MSDIAKHIESDARSAAPDAPADPISDASDDAVPTGSGAAEPKPDSARPHTPASLARRARGAAACLGLGKRRQTRDRLGLSGRLGVAAFVFFFVKGLVWLAVAAGSYVALAS